MISIKITPSSFKNLKVFCSEYLELLKVRNFLYIISDTSDGFSYIRCELLEGATDEDFHFRTESSYFKNVTDEKRLSIGINKNDIVLNFYNKDDKFVYSYMVKKYRGACQIDTYIDLEKSTNLYEDVSFIDESDFINSVSKLNLTISCVDKNLIAEVDNSYLLCKAKFIPNFCLSSSVLNKALRIDPNCKFVQNYMYFNVGDYHLFLYKFRSNVFDITSWLSSRKFTHKLIIDLENNLKYLKTLNFDDNDKIVLNFLNKQILINNENRTIKFPLSKVTFESKKSQMSLDDLLKNLNDPNNNKINPSTRTNMLPDITLPKWLLKYLILKPTLKLAISTTCIILIMPGIKLVLPRRNDK